MGKIDFFIVIDQACRNEQKWHNIWKAQRKAKEKAEREEQDRLAALAAEEQRPSTRGSGSVAVTAARSATHSSHSRLRSSHSSPALSRGGEMVLTGGMTTMTSQLGQTPARKSPKGSSSNSGPVGGPFHKFVER
mmetsp:Transcript_47846/g.84857  ORF Transcript_47846/g.84857 Transcript_47846/m.84857 type:complete len:134 (-) Transcript_47846:34-435(-)